jgi:hypothetical protein
MRTRVGFMREVPDRRSRGPGSTASSTRGPGLRHSLGSSMPKQHQPNGTPGKKPPAPSVKVRLGRKARRIESAERARRQKACYHATRPGIECSKLRRRLAPQLALLRSGESDPSVKGWIRSEPPLKVLTLGPILLGMSHKSLPQSQPAKTKPTKTKWHVYRLAAKREWVGEIEAVGEREAVEIAAKKFKQPAVPRR